MIVNRWQHSLGWLLILILLFTGCTTESGTTSSSSAVSPSSPTVSTVHVEQKTEAEMFTDRDRDATYDLSTGVAVQLNGTTALCNSKGVTINGSAVTITAEGTYIFSGQLTDGTIAVNAGEQDKIQLVLNGVSVTNRQSAALLILQADKVFVTLADGTDNHLQNGGVFATDENNIDGAVFSKQDLTINGTGALTVDSPVGHGIVCKDDMVFAGGEYTITAASHGIDANDSVRIVDSSFAITAGKDAIHAENSDDTTLGFVYIATGSVKAIVQGDGISAASYMQVLNGTFDLTTGGGSANGEVHIDNMMGGMGGHGSFGNPSNDTTGTTTDDVSTKGVKSGGEMLISGGEFTINSADDGVHANASIVVKSGSFTVASGDDGFHSDETLTVEGGTIQITQSYEGLEGLHVNIIAGEIALIAQDDGINAAGGIDQSGFGGPQGGDQFGGHGGHGGPGGYGGQVPPNGMAGNMATMGNGSTGSVTIGGGKVSITAGGDGIDSNGTLTITGGTVSVCGPTTGDTAVLDYDTTATMTGGTFIGTGAMQMAQTFSSTTAGMLAFSVGNQPAGTSVVITDSNGTQLLDHQPDLDFAIVIYCSSHVEKGATYSITVGSQTGDLVAY